MADLLLDRVQRLVRLTFAAPVALTTIGAVTGHTGFITLSNNLVAKHTFLGITTQWWVIVIGAAADLRLRGPADLRLAVVLAGPEVAVRARRAEHRARRGSAPVQERRHRRSSGTTSPRPTRASSTTRSSPLPSLAGFNPAHSFSLTATILMLPWVFFVVGYAQGSAQIGGEVKRASRTQYFAMVGGVLINGAVLAAIVLIYQHAVGSRWANSLSYVNNTAADKLGTPGGVPPSINYHRQHPDRQRPDPAADRHRVHPVGR